MRLELSSFVEEDLETIGDFIAKHNSTRAVSFVREIREKLNAIAERPEIYSLRPEIAEDARVAVFGRYRSSFASDFKRSLERVVSGYRDLNTARESF